MADPVMQAVRFDGRDKAMRLNKIKDRNRDKFSHLLRSLTPGPKALKRTAKL